MTLSFRQKVLLGYLAVFVTSLALLLKFAGLSVQRISTRALQNRADELIVNIRSAPNDAALVRRLKEEKALIFFRVTVLNDHGFVLYDSHASRQMGPTFSWEYTQDSPEVRQAFETGLGYYEDYSDLFGKKFAFMAKTFDFHSKTYVMRTAFPLSYVSELTRDFSVGFLTLGALFMLTFSLVTLLMINYLSKPINEIIAAIKPYGGGRGEVLPKVELGGLSPQDDFYRLANTLNSLSDRIQKQISILTDERNEKAALLETLIEGVIAVDPQLNITYANSTAMAMLGMTESDLLGAPFHVTGLSSCENLLRDCQDVSEIRTTTVKVARPKELTLDIVAAPFRGARGALLVLQDTSLQHQMLNLQRDFIANASHELKTPVTIVRGFAETLRDNPDLPKASITDATDKIVRNCERMNTLITDLLKLANLERLPDFLLEPCPLMDLIGRCTNTLLSVHPNAQVELDNRCGDDVSVLAHANLLEQALINLMTNAAKYSDKENPPISITIDGSDDKVSIAISDQGIGIPAVDLEHIFDRFYRVDKARTRKMGGTGLGLSIVKTIVDKHQGKIRAESEENKGSTFTITLLRHEIA